jgi:SAM-dependent methyltransferase
VLDMAEFALPRTEEPFDFRHQAATYARYRRDYSADLYDAIVARAGPAAGRLAIDVGCGTGFVTASLDRYGWHALGVDFSEPMLAGAREAWAGRLRLLRARGEALPVRDGRAALVTCGTSFHWLAPAPALAGFARALAPGGWVALFWRYAAPGEPSTRLVMEVLRATNSAVPPDFEQLRVHPIDPFGGSGLESVPPVVLRSSLEFTAADFHGYMGTLEWIRRFAGAGHAAFMARLRDVLAERHPGGFTERNEEYLFLARKPG